VVAHGTRRPDEGPAAVGVRERALSPRGASSFPDAEGRAHFAAIHAELTQVGEAGEGEGSVPTTLWLMSDETAAELAESIIALAARYGQP
jgi:hypothetical protein